MCIQNVLRSLFFYLVLWVFGIWCWPIFRGTWYYPCSRTQFFFFYSLITWAKARENECRECFEVTCPIWSRDHKSQYSETELTITQSLRQHFTAFLMPCFIAPHDSEVIICRNIKIFHQVGRSPPSMKNSEVSSRGIEWPVVNLRKNSAI